jgi:hypothetical protein
MWTWNGEPDFSEAIANYARDRIINEGDTIQVIQQ